MRPIAQMDTECDWDWWLIKFRMPDGRMFSYSICSEDPAPLNHDAVLWFFANFEIHSFNGWGYDLPMIQCALAGYDPRQLKQANDLLIVKRVRPYQLRDYFPAMLDHIPGLDHVDLMDVAPGVHLGLKLLMGRMHAPNIQDLPFDPNTPMPLHMRAVTDDYCGNDLHGTYMLGEEVKTRLALRRAITQKLDVDVRSKSDAQIAEAWFKAKIGRYIDRRVVPHGYQFQYTPPAYLAFSGELLRGVFNTVRAAWFPVYDVDQIRSSPDDEVIGPDGKKIKTGVKMPPEIKKLRITIGKTTYQMGIGGLHSTEKCRVVRTVAGRHKLKAWDVRSYYPSLILNSGMYPVQMGPEMLEIYREIYNGRLSNKDLAKRLTETIKGLKAQAAQGHPAVTAQQISEMEAERDRVKSDEGGEKIILNGTFGKLFSKFSVLFAPEQGIWVTLTGQLALLMLIESLELHGISVVSANTDGIVAEVPEHLEAQADAIVAWWEQRTGLVMESELYDVIFSASVNSYVGVKKGGAELTLKGDFKKTGVDNNGTPAFDIATTAAVEYLVRGTPVETTLRACQDVRQFVSVRKVKGGGMYGDQFLGKVVRWYQSTRSTGPIRDGGSGNKVAGTDGAMPLMQLRPGIPDDMDYAAYAGIANALIERAGVSVQ